MAIDKPLGTENDPNVKNLGSAVEIQPDTSREDQIRAAAEILVSEENLLVDGEIEQAAPAMNFNMNLAEVLPQDILQSISSDLLSSIKGDKQSRSEWEKTYTDGLKYLGMKFDDARSQPFEGRSRENRNYRRTNSRNRKSSRKGARIYELLHYECDGRVRPGVRSNVVLSTFSWISFQKDIF